MAIALFGATGRTGRLLLGEARTRGWPVRALVRDAARLPQTEGLRVVAGDARDAAVVDALLAGPGGKVGAVICALGLPDITRPSTDFSDSVKTIVLAMQRTGVRRIVAIASAGVLDHPAGGLRFEHELPDWLRHIAAEHGRNLETLQGSGLDWTLMCPLNLVDDIPVGHVQWQYEGLPLGSPETGYADLARTMADLLTERASLKRRVGIVSLRPTP